MHVDTAEVALLAELLPTLDADPAPHRWYVRDGWVIRPFDGLALDPRGMRAVQVTLDRSGVSLAPAAIPRDPAVLVGLSLFSRAFEPAARGALAGLAGTASGGVRAVFYGVRDDAWGAAVARADALSPFGRYAFLRGRGRIAMVDGGSGDGVSVIAVTVGSAPELLRAAPFERTAVLAGLCELDVDEARRAVESGAVPIDEVLPLLPWCPELAEVEPPDALDMQFDTVGGLLRRAEQAIAPELRGAVARAARRRGCRLVVRGERALIVAPIGLALAMVPGPWLMFDLLLSRVVWCPPGGDPTRGRVSGWPPSPSDARSITPILLPFRDDPAVAAMLAETGGIAVDVDRLATDPRTLCYAAAGRRAPAVFGWHHAGLRAGAVVWRRDGGWEAATTVGWAVVRAPDGSLTAADASGFRPYEGVPRPLLAALAATAAPSGG